MIHCQVITPWCHIYIYICTGNAHTHTQMPQTPHRFVYPCCLYPFLGMLGIRKPKRAFQIELPQVELHVVNMQVEFLPGAAEKPSTMNKRMDIKYICIYTHALNIIIIVLLKIQCDLINLTKTSRGCKCCNDVVPPERT